MPGTTRPTCSVFIGTSLDGYIARRDGGIDFLDLVNDEGEDYGFAEFFASIDTLVLGRVTYETALGFDPWPYADKRCVVLTRSQRTAVHGESFAAARPVDLVRRLGEEGSRRIYVDGGQVISSFLEAGLIDELTISIIPVLIGDGIRLFRGPFADHRLDLVLLRSFPSGLSQLRYTVRH